MERAETADHPQYSDPHLPWNRKAGQSMPNCPIIPPDAPVFSTLIGANRPSLPPFTDFPVQFGASSIILQGVCDKGSKYTERWSSRSNRHFTPSPPSIQPSGPTALTRELAGAYPRIQQIRLLVPRVENLVQYNSNPWCRWWKVSAWTLRPATSPVNTHKLNGSNHRRQG